MLLALLGAVVTWVAEPPACGQAADPAVLPPPVALPRVECASPLWDFGSMASTVRVEHAFVLSNQGLAPLHIQQVIAGCGCAAARAGSDNVPPGGTTQVFVSFSLTGRSGTQRKSIYVHTNDPEKPILQLEMRGEVLANGASNGVADLVAVGIWDGVARSVPSSVSFGRVKADAISEAEIALRGATSNDAVAVQGVETGTTGLVARVEVTNGVCRVMLRLLPRTELGPGSATVLIRTSHPILKAVRVPVTWVADGDLYATPGEITVVARPGATNGVVRHVAIRSRSGKPVRVEAVTSDDPGVKAETTPSPDGGSVLVRVSGIPLSGNRSLLVRGADGTSLAVPIVARTQTERP